MGGADLENNTFMDERSLAVGQTMIRFVADITTPSVPSEVGPLSLTELASGSVSSGSCKQLTVEEGYVRICSGAIRSQYALHLELPHTLRELAHDFVHGTPPSEIVFHRHLTPGEMSALRDASFPCGGGKRILIPNQISGEVFRPVYDATCCMMPALPYLDRRMTVLMTDVNGMTVFNPAFCHDLSGTETKLEEYAAVMRMIRLKARGWRHPEAERRSDLRVRSGDDPPRYRESLTLVEYSPEEHTLLPDGRFAVKLRLFSGPFLTPALLPVTCGGKTYYLYSRQHLMKDPECPYWREDMGIFDENGLVTDPGISEDAYVKARLPMLL